MAELGKDRFEVCSFAAGERSLDVFPDSVLWVLSMCTPPHFFDDTDRLVEQTGTGAVKPRALPGDTHVLTRRTECDYVHGWQVSPGEL